MARRIASSSLNKRLFDRFHHPVSVSFQAAPPQRSTRRHLASRDAPDRGHLHPLAFDLNGGAGHRPSRLSPVVGSGASARILNLQNLSEPSGDIAPPLRRRDHLGDHASTSFPILTHQHGYRTGGPDAHRAHREEHINGHDFPRDTPSHLVGLNAPGRCSGS